MTADFCHPNPANSQPNTPSVASSPEFVASQGSKQQELLRVWGRFQFAGGKNSQHIRQNFVASFSTGRASSISPVRYFSPNGTEASEPSKCFLGFQIVDLGAAQNGGSVSWVQGRNGGNEVT
jgi:hypothetical protein